MRGRQKYPCPCCGYLVFEAPPGSYAICPICFWEDDIVQLRLPTMLGGPNKTTLVAAQRTFARLGACEERLVKQVRRPDEGDTRDSGWRPIEEDQDSFEDPDAPDIAHSYPDDPTELYYWRPTFWRRGSA